MDWPSVSYYYLLGSVLCMVFIQSNRCEGTTFNIPLILKLVSFIDQILRVCFFLKQRLLPCVVTFSVTAQLKLIENHCGAGFLVIDINLFSKLKLQLC